MTPPMTFSIFISYFGKMLCLFKYFIDGFDLTFVHFSILRNLFKLLFSTFFSFMMLCLE